MCESLCVCVCVSLGMFVCESVYVSLGMFVCESVYVCVCVCVCINMCVGINIIYVLDFYSQLAKCRFMARFIKHLPMKTHRRQTNGTLNQPQGVL